MTRLAYIASLLIITAVAGCGSNPASDPNVNTPPLAAGKASEVAADGSSTVYPVTEAVAEEFQTEQGGKVHVTVGISGTGGGFKKFGRGEIDISAASRPISTEEIKLCQENKIEFIELPVCFDALTIVVNTKNDWVDSITTKELKMLWETAADGKVTHWNHIRPDWPSEKVLLFGAGSDSGTFDYFTEAICGKAKASRSDYTASEDDNVLVQGIAGNEFALGYLPFAYYEPNKEKLKALAVDWDKDELPAVLPSLDNVLNGTYNPLSRPLFIYVSKKSAERPEVQAFTEYYLNNVAELAKEVNYLPLPAKAYEQARARFEKRQTGSGFGGVPEVGVTVEELLQREPK